MYLKTLFLTELFFHINKHHFFKNGRILINKSLFPREEDSPQLDRVQFSNTLKIMPNGFICSKF